MDRSGSDGALARLLRRLGLLASPPEGYAYHGFISYSHAADGKLAPALQRGLQRFAKPWYQARALRVFRDDASMAVNANLWKTIEQALEDSEYYVLLASPEAAKSEWVTREVRRWRETKPIDHLLIALTDGRMAWDARGSDFDWERTNALPQELSGAFEDEPRFIDLRWARAETDLSLGQARFRDAVADLAAPLHGRPKDELASEEVIQQRRAVRARRVVASALVAITALALAAGIVALAQRRSALRTARVVQSQLLASRALASTDASQASLLALEAYRTSSTFDARAALLGVAQNHQLGGTFDPGRALYGAALSPDGRTLATGGGDGTLALWDVASHRLRWRLPAPAGGGDVGAVAFSPNGRELAYAQNSGRPTVSVLELASRAVRFSLRGDTARVNALAFSPDGRALASASSDRTVRVIDVRGGRISRVLRGHSGPVSSVAFSGDGRELASSSCDQATHSDTGDHAVLVWDAASGRVLARLRGSYSVCGVALSPDGRLAAAAADDGAVSLWNVRAGRPEGLPLVGHTDFLTAVAFSPNGKLVASASLDHTVRIWDLASRREAYAPLSTARAVNSVAFSANGARLASAGFDGAQVWSVAAPSEAGTLADGARDTLSVAFSPDGRYLAWSDDRSGGTVRVWDSALARELRPITAPGQGFDALAFALGGRVLVLAARSQVVVWDPVAGRVVQRIPVRAGAIVSRVAVSPDGRVLAFDQVVGGHLSSISLWDLAKRRALGTPVVGLAGRLGALAFSPDGRLLASGGLDDGAVRLWDVGRLAAGAGSGPGSGLGRGVVGRGGDRGVLLGRHGGSVFALAFSPDGHTLVSAGADEAIRVWDVGRRRALGTLAGVHSGPVYGVAFSHDGKLLATAGNDGYVRLWDVAAHRELLTLPGHSGYAYEVAFSPDGRLLASTGSDGVVRLWSGYAIGPAITRLCTYFDPAAAPALWRQLQSSIPYRRAC